MPAKSAKSLLQELTKNKKSAPPKQDRPTVEVTEPVLAAFTRLVGANAVLQVAEARKEVEEELIKEEMLTAFAEALYRIGSVPANPRLETKVDDKPDMAGIFQVQNRFKITIPESVDGNEDITARFVFALQSVGMGDSDAEQLVATEIDAEPLVALRPFNELVNGHYEGEGKNKTFVEATEQEKATGQKLLQFAMGMPSEPLTEAEKDIALRYEDRIKVKEGFLQRLRGYCKSEAILRGVLRVITPVHFVSHMKYGISDTPEEKQRRLVGIATELVTGQAVEEPQPLAKAA